MKTKIKSTALLLAIATVALTGINAKVITGVEAVEKEPELKIENWMTTDLSNSNAETGTTATMFVAEYEPELSIESWMTYAPVWNPTLMNATTELGIAHFMTEKEPELKIENWMISDNSWSVLKLDIVPEIESDLAVKAWMTDENKWR